MARKPAKPRKPATEPPPPENPARAFAIEAARLAKNTRCHSVVMLDVSRVSPITDYFVIATGTSARQMRSVADELVEIGKKVGFAYHRMDGYDSAAWVLVDFVDVVIHLFGEEARHYYDLENLWGDAPQVEFDETKPTA